MKIRKERITGIVFLMFILYSVSPNFFERRLYFNELLSLTGLAILASKSYKNKKFILADSRIYKLVCALIALGILHMLISLYLKTSFYFYFRNSVIIYSIFSFFIGFYWLGYFNTFIESVRISLRIILGGVVLSGVKPLLDRFVAAAFFPFFFKKYTPFTVIPLAVMNVIYAITFESLTVTLVTIILLSIIAIRNFVLFQLATCVALVSIVGLTIYLKPSIELYKTGPYRLFGNIEAVIQDHFLLRADDNSTWRLVFWYRLVTENFPRNIFGIGMGTPLLPYKHGVDTAITNLDGNTAEYQDEHDIHVMGGHNTYLTLSVRLGAGFIIILLLIYRTVFKEYYQWLSYYRRNGQIFLFFSFFIISIIGLFNLVLESPISAATYWILLGLVARAIHNRKYIFSRLQPVQDVFPHQALPISQIQ